MWQQTRGDVVNFTLPFPQFNAECRSERVIKIGMWLMYWFPPDPLTSWKDDCLQRCTPSRSSSTQPSVPPG